MLAFGFQQTFFFFFLYIFLFFFIFFFFFFFFLRPHLQHMEVPRLGFKSELQLQAYTTWQHRIQATSACSLRCSLQQCLILKPLSKARDPTYILMDS